MKICFGLICLLAFSFLPACSALSVYLLCLPVYLSLCFLATSIFLSYPPPTTNEQIALNVRACVQSVFLFTMYQRKVDVDMLNAVKCVG